MKEKFYLAQVWNPNANCWLLIDLDTWEGGTVVRRRYNEKPYKNIKHLITHPRPECHDENTDKSS